MNIFDRFIERIFKSYLHKKRDHHINKAIKKFAHEHTELDPQTIVELKKLLENEAARLYPMVDKSILCERIKRAKYVFVITAIASAILAAIIMLITHGTAIVFIAPLFSALFAWVATLATIPIGYDQRIIGGMDSVITVFEEKLNKANREEDVKNLQNQDIDTLKAIIHTLNNQNEHMQHEIEDLKDIVKESNKTINNLTTNLGMLVRNQIELQTIKATPQDSFLEHENKQPNFRLWHKSHRKLYLPQSRSTPTLKLENIKDIFTDPNEIKNHEREP